MACKPKAYPNSLIGHLTLRLWLRFLLFNLAWLLQGHELSPDVGAAVDAGASSDTSEEEVVSLPRASTKLASSQRRRLCARSRIAQAITYCSTLWVLTAPRIPRVFPDTPATLLLSCYSSMFATIPCFAAATVATLSRRRAIWLLAHRTP